MNRRPVVSGLDYLTSKTMGEFMFWGFSMLFIWIIMSDMDNKKWKAILFTVAVIETVIFLYHYLLWMRMN